MVPCVTACNLSIVYIYLDRMLASVIYSYTVGGPQLTVVFQFYCSMLPSINKVLNIIRLITIIITNIIITIVTILLL